MNKAGNSTQSVPRFCPGFIGCPISSGGYALSFFAKRPVVQVRLKKPSLALQNHSARPSTSGRRVPLLGKPDSATRRPIRLGVGLGGLKWLLADRERSRTHREFVCKLIVKRVCPRQVAVGRTGISPEERIPAGGLVRGCFSGPGELLSRGKFDSWNLLSIGPDPLEYRAR